MKSHWLYGPLKSHCFTWCLLDIWQPSLASYQVWIWRWKTKYERSSKNETERITITIRLNIRNYFIFHMECVWCAPDSSWYVGGAKAIGIMHCVCIACSEWASMCACMNHQTSQHQTCHCYRIVVVIINIVVAVVVMFAVLFVILSMT